MERQGAIPFLLSQPFIGGIMNIAAALLVSLSLAVFPAFAQDKPQPATATPGPATQGAAKGAKADQKREASDKQKAQQARMSECNGKAKDMKGDDRKKFMSSCLRGEDGVSNKQQAQRDKMASCNKEAGSKALKGDDRKKFMSDCLKA
jgi:predicted lipid-binding transport protein (Tim44 family)